MAKTIRTYAEDDVVNGAVILMESGNINRQQALETLAMFPKLSDAEAVVGHFKGTSKEDSPATFTGYDDFLEIVRIRIYGPTEAKSPYQTEVEERTTKIDQEKLTRQAIGINPTDRSISTNMHKQGH